MPIKKFSGSHGISMLEILIGIGILGLVLPFAYKLLIGSRQFSAASEDRFNLRSVARTVESFVDCPAIPKTCTTNQMLNLPKKNGGILVRSDGQTVMGGWTIRAFCTGGNQFKVQAAASVHRENLSRIRSPNSLWTGIIPKARSLMKKPCVQVSLRPPFQSLMLLK
ncbi:MAG TPA: hypothetical protein VE954_15460 [Oligoflexus sp.]|uniref:hypothetical protein n=1 Tax=Oligoflexus sp. TaxID=1971216 RepID=UPI002D3E3508|nr:hypothetical protein [Oligoflexus sp.]HYX34501.1 hypothetical protein [Oligoflexus sp.]